MDPQSNTYKKDDYCDAIVLLYKGQITEVSLLSVWSVSGISEKGWWLDQPAEGADRSGVLEQTQAWAQEPKIRISRAQEGISRNGRQMHVISEPNGPRIRRMPKTGSNFGCS